MSARQVAFVAFDVDRIKEFVFATHRPMDATGASELIKRLDQEELPSRFLQGFSEVQISYTHVAVVACSKWALVPRRSSSARR